MLGSTEDNRGAGHYGAIITPSFAFGLDVACKNCLWHIEGERMLWSVGAQMALYNTQSHEMRFIPLADRGARALVLAVAHNFKYFAVAERVPGLEYDQISVYAFGGDKRVKTLPLEPGATRPESSRVECMHFSENSKYLMVQYGTPDWTLVIWRWYNGKVLASHRMESRPVLSARFSPVDDLLLAVMSPTSLCQYRLDLDREVLSVTAAPQHWEPFQLSSMSWIAGNMVAAVGAGGLVQVFQQSTTRMTTRVEPLSRGAAAEAEEEAAAAASSSGREHLLVVASRGRGFIAGGTSGTVYFFEPPSVEQKRAGIRDLYVLVRRLSVDLPPPPDLGSGQGHRGHRPAGAASALPPGITLPLPPGVNPGLSGTRPLVLLSVSAGDEEVVAVSAYGDVAVASMAVVLEREEKPIAEVVGPELLEGEPFTRLMGGFMTGRVVGLAAAATQPLIAAVSSDDRQLRVWNYEARRCVASLSLEDEPLCLDLHPGGQLLLLALPDKIKMLSVMLDALEPLFEVAMKRPTALRFSTGGAMFAYVGRTNALHLHATYHGQPLLAVLKAHASAVSDLRFSADDRMLVSVGAGGAVYFWDLSSYSRVMDLELVDKQALYCSVAVSNSETGAAVVRASDGRVQQIYNGKVQYEVACRGSLTAPSCLLGADKVLLAADEYGGVVSHVWPSELPPRPGFGSLAPPPHPYPLHSAVGGGISRMVLVPSRGLLFTAGGDGTVLMSSVALVLDGILLEAAQGGLGGSHPRSRQLATLPSRLSTSASQRTLGGIGAVSLAASTAAATVGSCSSSSSPYYITIPEDRLLALRERAIEVAMRVGSAKNDAEYQAFRATQLLRDTISRLEGELEAAQAALADKDVAIARMQESGALNERKVVKELEGAHMSAAEELEALYEKRLLVEMERVKVMAAARDDMRYRGEEEVRRLRALHEREMDEQRSAYEAQLAALEARMAEAGEARQEQDRFFSEYVKQAEEDFEDHSDRINKKVHVLAEAAEGREQKLKADNNILKRTNLRLKADKTIDMKRMDKLTTDNAQLREQTEDLRITIAKLTKELEERDAVNADNYVTIQQLRRKVQELEKHKYVLSYKAESYSKNLEPQQEEISRLQEALEGHGRELLSQANRAQILTRHVAEKDAALRTAKTGLAAFKRRCELQDAAITSFAQELYAAMQLPDDRSVHGKSSRQKALDDLVRKYCLGDPRVSANRNAASEAIATAAAAETRVVLLQWRLDQDARTSRVTSRISLQQNAQLLRELQVAQQDNRALRDRVDAAVVALRELQHRYAMLERKAGLRSGPRSTAGGAGGAGAGAGAGEGPEEELTAEGGGSGGEEEGGGAVVSMAGRVPPSRPVSGAGPAASSPSPHPARRTSAALTGANSLPRHSHAQPHPQPHGGQRPGTAGGARPPSPGWGLHRSVGGGASARASIGGVGSVGGGAAGVSKGAPLKAFADLLVSERQRMQSLATQLESGAMAVERQQRALLGLRDQLAAAAAVGADDDDGDGDGDDGEEAGTGGGGGGQGEGYGYELVGAEVSLGRMQGGWSTGRFAGLGLQEGQQGEEVEGGGRGGAEGEGEGDVADSTATTGGSGSGSGEGGEAGASGREWDAGRQQQQPVLGGAGSSTGTSRRVTLVSAGGGAGGGGGGGGGSTGGGVSPFTYNAPGLRGLNVAVGGAGGSGNSGGGATPTRFHTQPGTNGRPLTASVSPRLVGPASRRSTASPSGLPTSPTTTTTTASASRLRPSSSTAGVRSSTGLSPGTSTGGVGAGAGVAGSGGRSTSPTGRRRPSSAGGVGLRAFTDDKVDRFRPAPTSSQQELPF
ncbi:WD repeat-containing protein 49 [Pleodorina starrii]|nr:WD repeat-containing protein 49 [Pleodorina starrii]